MRLSKKKISIILLPLWVVGIFYLIRLNPSSKEAHIKLEIMRSDYEIMMEGERQEVLGSSEQAKFGGALFSKTLRWSKRSSNLEVSLTALGWKSIGGSPPEYCKNQILSSVDKGVITASGETVVYLAMQYNVQSIKKCQSS